MKSLRILLQAALILTGLCARGQGTFIYDQQSSTDEYIPFYGEGEAIQHLSPVGQSFTPSLSAVGFVRLKLNDGDTGDGSGATLYVNLRSGSITGPILDSSATTRMPSLFRGNTNFFFANPVPVTPGVKYYFEVIVQSGGLMNMTAGSFNYPGGTTISQGIVLGGSDVWFREGIVPEPSAALLLLAGTGVSAYVRRARSKNTRRDTDGSPLGPLM